MKSNGRAGRFFIAARAAASGRTVSGAAVAQTTMSKSPRRTGTSQKGRANALSSAESRIALSRRRLATVSVAAPRL